MNTRAGSGGSVPALSEPLRAPKGRWSDLSLRAASALVLAPLALFCLWRGGLAWELFLAAALAGLGHEWGRLAGLRQGWALPLFLLIAWAAAIWVGPPAGLLALLALTLAAWPVYGGFAALGLPYAGLAGLAMLWLRARPEYGLAETGYLILVIWGTDIGAYAVGRLLGGAKLAPRISPGKTWSGALGGLGIGAGCGAAAALAAQAAPVAAFCTGLLLSMVAQAGDLLESAIKRKLGVKDSGRTIPGHGGLFDRLDGFLTAAPVAALLTLAMQGGLG
jgi:phosphatidate cytidylyltransferase